MSKRAELEATKDLAVLQEKLDQKHAEANDSSQTVSEETMEEANKNGGKIKLKSYLEARKKVHRLGAKGDKLREIRGDR